MRALLQELVAQPALPTLARLNDSLARRFARVAVTTLQWYASTHQRRPTTKVAIAEALDAAQWVWVLPMLLARRPPKDPGKQVKRDPGALPDQILEDTGQDVSTQDVLRRRLGLAAPALRPPAPVGAGGKASINT